MENAIFHKLVDFLQERNQLQEESQIMQATEICNVASNIADYMGATEGTHVPISVAPCLQDPY
ncbi:hypothetical protein C2845_PM10G18500 [Panicum miliaceum]|uniref:Uncharacterized protein n=1 Tax=Panicum miliaceum TaxID=4540 RepID=A0A3L6PA88_PANMI|nr:hypothetical protein C2845_PM10G18500 [Panicum miliaceum]